MCERLENAKSEKAKKTATTAKEAAAKAREALENTEIAKRAEEKQKGLARIYAELGNLIRGPRAGIPDDPR